MLKLWDAVVNNQSFRRRGRINHFLKMIAAVNRLNFQVRILRFQILVFNFRFQQKKFEPGQGIEPLTSRPLAWRSTIWAVLEKLTGGGLNIYRRQWYARCGLWHYLLSFDRRTNFVFIYLFILRFFLIELILKYRLPIWFLLQVKFHFE